MPDDLKKLIQDIRKANNTSDFRNIPATIYMQWIDRIGHKKKPSLLKTFRFNQ